MGPALRRPDPGRPGGPRRRPVAVAGTLAATLGLAGLVGLAGCSSEGGDAADTAAKATTTTVAPRTTTTIRRQVDPSRAPGECPTAAEMEELLGGPVEVSRSFNGSVSMAPTGDATLGYSSEGCSFELTEGGQGEVDVERAHTDDDLGDTTLYERLERNARAQSEAYGFTAIEDLGEAAWRDGADLVLRTDDAMVFVTAEDADDQDVFEPAREVAEAVPGLHLDGAERPDCDAVEAAAEEAVGPVDQTIPSGGFIGVNDVSITTQGCNVTFADGAEVTVAVTAPDQWDAWVAAKKASTFTATFEEVAVGGHRAFDDGEALFVDDGEQPLRITAEGDDLQPGEAEVRRSVAELTLYGS